MKKTVSFTQEELVICRLPARSYIINTLIDRGAPIKWENPADTSPKGKIEQFGPIKEYTDLKGRLCFSWNDIYQSETLTTCSEGVQA